MVRASGGLRCPEYYTTSRDWLRVFPPNIKKRWRGWAHVREWLVLRTVNVNWNGDGWNANANALDDNRWNDDNQVFSRNSYGSPACAGVLLSNPLFQP
ncbi:MAG: hypothetical protein AAB897_01060 [Patescibacteria group bacterium]